VADDDLRLHSEELKTPFFVKDPFFGRMELNRSLNWLESKRRIGLFSRYSVCVERNGETYDANRAREIVTSLEKRMPEIREVIRKDLYDLYSDHWESVGPLSESQFLKRIKLESIVVEESGSAECWFEDGGLFSGHSIEVRISKGGEIVSAGLSG
jgi:hypothetical protein